MRIMKLAASTASCCCLCWFWGGAVASQAPIPVPVDRPYPGDIRLQVDATDLEHRVFHVRETITGVNKDSVLLYPKWLPGTHAPQGPIDRFAGLRITANGLPVTWTRDTVDIYAVHVHPAPEVHTLDLQFDYLSPTTSRVGAMEVSRDVMMVEWNEVILYPAGYFSRQIPVTSIATIAAEVLPG
jgi:hypothetical protein